MCVIAIVGVLSAVAVPAYKSSISKANLSVLGEQLSIVNNKIKMYYAENGIWPNGPSQIWYTTQGGGGFGWSCPIKPNHALLNTLHEYTA